MSRTTRRGKPTRNFHKYIGKGVICNENRRWFSYWAIPEHQGHLYWKNGANDTTTYEEYVALEIRRYHMDYRLRDKCPGFMHREDTLKQKRQHKASLSKALHSGDFDVVLEPYVNGAKRMWEWW